MEQLHKTKYAVNATEFIRSHIQEHCNELQKLDTLLQNRDQQILQKNKEHIQLLIKQEVLKKKMKGYMIQK